MSTRLRVTFSGLVLFGGTTAIALGATTSDNFAVPFPFQTPSPSVCDTGTLDSNGSLITNVKFAPVVKNGSVVGCRLTFTSDAAHLRPPFKATFKYSNGDTFTVTGDQLGLSSSRPGTPPPLPAGWNRIQNTQDYNTPAL
jgi:hypothetical protein